MAIAFPDWVRYKNKRQKQTFSPRYLYFIQSGNAIYTHLIPTKFEQSSRVPVPEELKLTEAEKIAGNMLKMETFTQEQIAQATGVSLDRIEQLSTNSKVP